MCIKVGNSIKYMQHWHLCPTSVRGKNYDVLCENGPLEYTVRKILYKNIIHVKQYDNN